MQESLEEDIMDLLGSLERHVSRITLHLQRKTMRKVWKSKRVYELLSLIYHSLRLLRLMSREL